MYKYLGLLSEEVAELGRWENLQAFSRHYMRVGASKKAGQSLLSALVHKVSPGKRAEDDGSWTPVRKPDAGGKDPEDEARRPGEPSSAHPGRGHAARKSKEVPREPGESPPRKFSFARPPTAVTTALTSTRTATKS